MDPMHGWKKKFDQLIQRALKSIPIEYGCSPNMSKLEGDFLEIFLGQELKNFQKLFLNFCPGR